MSEQRVALVTGGNKGIGLEIVRQLLRQVSMCSLALGTSNEPELPLRVCRRRI